MIWNTAFRRRQKKLKRSVSAPWRQDRGKGGNGAVSRLGDLMSLPMASVDPEEGQEPSDSLLYPFSKRHGASTTARFVSPGSTWRDLTGLPCSQELCRGGTWSGASLQVECEEVKD